MRLKNSRLPALLIVPLLLALALSFIGCATQSPSPRVAPPAIPQPPPALMISPEPGTYSDAVQRLFNSWRLLLTPSKPD